MTTIQIVAVAMIVLLVVPVVWAETSYRLRRRRELREVAQWEHDRRLSILRRYIEP